jgi:hypothetical protein
MPSTHAPEQASPATLAAPASQPSTRRVAVLLFLFLSFLYLLTSSGRVRSMDEIDPVMQSESLLLRHSTALPQALASGVYFGKLDRFGMPRSAWPAGHALLLVPWSWLGHDVLAHLPGMPANIADLANETAICWSNATFAALAVTAAFLLFLELGLARGDALAASFLVAFATPLFVYSAWLYSEPVSIALLFTCALLLFRRERSTAGTVAALLLLGFSFHLRPDNTLMVAVFIAATAIMEHESERAGFRYPITTALIAVAIVSGVLYLARNQWLFGNPLDFGVPATAEGGKDLNSWHNPLCRGLFGFLLSPGKSVFLFCPPIVLGIAGLPRLWRRNPGLATLCGLAPLVNLFFYSFRTQWEGGYCWGPRYLVPSVLLLTLPAAALFLDPPRWLRPAFWSVAAAGLLVQLIGLSTNIVEDMVTNHYFIGNWDYRMRYSPISGQLRLIWKYLHQKPAGLGLGWDRWWLFLHAAGASWAVLVPIVAIFILGAVVSGMLLWRCFRGRGLRRAPASAE